MEKISEATKKRFEKLKEEIDKSNILNEEPNIYSYDGYNNKINKTDVIGTIVPQNSRWGITNGWKIVEVNMLRGGKQLNETIEKNIDKFREGKVLNMDLYNRTVNEELSQTLTDPSHNSQRLFDGFRIRKLTPKECWRLMGFDDEDCDKAAQVNSNTQLYKQAGNSIVVNVLEAILTSLLLEPNQDIPKGQTTIFDYGV